jgi:hypothetical protein
MGRISEIRRIIFASAIVALITAAVSATTFANSGASAKIEPANIGLAGSQSDSVPGLMRLAASGGDCPMIGNDRYAISCVTSVAPKPGYEYNVNGRIHIKNGYYCRFGFSAQVSWCKRN